MESAQKSVSKKEIAALIAIYIIFGLAQSSNEFRTLFLKGQGLSATECGRVLAGASLLTVFAGPVASALADKLRSRRIVYIISSSLWIVFLALLIITRNYRIAGFALCAGIMPLMSICDPITYNMIEASGVNASIKVPKLDFSIIRVFLSAGYCLINFAHTPLVARFGPSAPFICTMVFVIVLLILSGTLRSFETGSASSAGRTRQKLELGRLFQNYYLVSFLILALIQSIGLSNGSYLVFLMTERGMDTALIGTAGGIRVVGEIIIMLSLPFIKRFVSLPLLQVLSTCINVIQLVIYLTSRNPVVILSALVLGGAATGIGLGSRAVYLRKLAPEGLDTLTITLYSSMHAIGSVIMNLVGGIIIDARGIYSLYRLSMTFIIAYIVLYFASWAFGKYILKKEPPMPLFSVYRK